MCLHNAPLPPLALTRAAGHSFSRWRWWRPAGPYQSSGPSLGLLRPSIERWSQANIRVPPILDVEGSLLPGALHVAFSLPLLAYGQPSGRPACSQCVPLPGEPHMGPCQLAEDLKVQEPARGSVPPPCGTMEVSSWRPNKPQRQDDP